jgi:hypothetical protein
MPLTRTPLLSETVRKLVARGAYVNAFNILNRLHPLTSPASSATSPTTCGERPSRPFTSGI